MNKFLEHAKTDFFLYTVKKIQWEKTTNGVQQKLPTHAQLKLSDKILKQKLDTNKKKKPTYFIIINLLALKNYCKGLSKNWWTQGKKFNQRFVHETFATVFFSEKKFLKLFQNNL